MNTIRKREELGRNVVRYVVDAPLVATHRKPGQFVIIRVTDHGERIPLTIADANLEMGTISLIVQSVGKTTREMAMLQPGNVIHDIVGPWADRHISSGSEPCCAWVAVSERPRSTLSRRA